MLEQVGRPPRVGQSDVDEELGELLVGLARVALDGEQVVVVAADWRQRHGLQHAAVPVEQHNDSVASAEEAIRDLDQQPGAVAAHAVGVEPAPMREPRERLHGEPDSLVAKLGRGHKTHAAGGAARGEIPRPLKA